MVEQITVRQYMRIVKINESALDDTEKEKQILEIFHDDLGSLSKEDGDKLYNSIALLLNKPVNSLIQRFKLNDVEYGFIPNLDMISTAEYIDLNRLLEDKKELHRIAAILYRPITKSDGEQYRIEKYKGTGKYMEQMRELDFRVVLGAIVFFSILETRLLKHSPTYIQMLEKRNKKKGRLGIIRRSISSIKSLGGIICFWKRQEATT